MAPQGHVNVFRGPAYNDIEFHMLPSMAPLLLDTSLHNGGRGPYNQSSCFCHSHSFLEPRVQLRNSLWSTTTRRTRFTVQMMRTPPAITSRDDKRPPEAELSDVHDPNVYTGGPLPTNTNCSTARSDPFPVGIVE